MLNRSKKFIILLSLGTIISSACTLPLFKNVNLVISVATISASSEKDGSQSTDTPTPSVTMTPTPTLTTTPMQTITQTATPTPEEAESDFSTGSDCNRAQFVRDVNYPDGSNLYAGTSFDKTWRLMNVGTCTWTSGYSVVFSSGYRMGAPYSRHFTKVDIEPGESVDITLSFTSPEYDGYYTGSFMLRSSDGEVFGVGSQGITPFWVKINSYSSYYYYTSTLTPTEVPTRKPKTPKPPFPPPPSPVPPTSAPTTAPTAVPTTAPTAVPTSAPTAVPTDSPVPSPIPT